MTDLCHQSLSRGSRRVPTVSNGTYPTVGLAEWDVKWTTVLFRYQKIELVVVPAFLLTSNFKCFRAVLDVGRWSEGDEDTLF